ncbi:MAG: leucine--tRNA ligase [bacterium]
MVQYNPKAIEKKWQKIWREKKLHSPDLDKAKRPFYNLMMFPYPSAEGLHVGNMYAFIHSDAYGRYIRMKGFDVFEPIGLDGFGIHSENYAIKIKEHIRDVSQRTEKKFYEQLKMIGNQYDWSRTVETYKPNYYKWTQWLFLQMYKKGLVYRAKLMVNWCPSCKTVLADEQVISSRCERCSSEVEKREMEQWFFRITDYVERLLKNLDWIDWPEDVKTGQRNWIGKSEGTLIKFKIPMPTGRQENSKQFIEVFTTRVDTIFGCTYLVVAPEHPLIQNNELRIKNYEEVKKYVEQAKKKSELQRTDLAKEKTGVELKGVKAINPFNNEEVPIYVADYVLGHYGTGAVMAVPAHDERDFEFAKKYNSAVKEVIVEKSQIPKHSPIGGAMGRSNPNPPAGGQNSKQLERAFVEDGILVDSGQFINLTSEKARAEMTKWLEKNNFGGRKINYKLRDWCVSRQRYWGPPIPMIYCEKCARLRLGEGGQGWQPVAEEDLPVLLPELDDFLPDGSGKGPLNKVKDFVKTTCPKCGGPAKRETDVSDPFVDSSWYFLRYPCTEFADRAFDKKRLAKWLPVNMYIGGKEHTVLHLLYSRFVAMVLHDLDYLKEEEPFKRFFAHGLLIKEGAKISKSRGNIVNPDKYIEKYGADSVRLYLMFLGDVRQGGDWREAGMAGMFRFVKRVWDLAEEIIRQGKPKTTEIICQKAIHRAIKRVGDDLERLKFNTAIAAIMEYINALQDCLAAKKEIGQDAVLVLAKILAPFAPYLAEELWHELGNKKSIFQESWPSYDAKIIAEEKITLVIQINGKLRDRLEVERGLPQKEAEELALSQAKIKSFLAGREIKKIIFVRDKLINIVAG